jgi:hypothetical protein
MPDTIYEREAAQARLEEAYREGPAPVEAMSQKEFADQWHQQGGGEPVPFTFRHASGEMMFDVTRLEDVSPAAQEAAQNRVIAGVEKAREGRIAAEMERLPADVSPMERGIPDRAQARAEIDAALDRGERPHFVRPGEAYEARWRAAGGGSEVQPAFVDRVGHLWVDGEGMEGF